MTIRNALAIFYKTNGAMIKGRICWRSVSILKERRVEFMKYAIGLYQPKWVDRSQEMCVRGLGARRCSRDCTSTSLKQGWGEGRLKKALDRLGRTDLQACFCAFASLLRYCAHAKALCDGRRVHADIIRTGYGSNRFIGNLLVQMYGKCGLLEDARGVFDKIRQRNLFSWNIMIQVYATNGRVQDARCVFDRMCQRDVVSWTAMITAYSRNGHGKAALELFTQMQRKGVEPNRITFISILDACAGLAALQEGTESHAIILESGFESDAVVGTSLVNMYGKCGSVANARHVFDKMPQRNVISWNAMITAFSQNGHGKDAVELFERMQLEGVQSNKITFISVLDACASLAALAKGMENHASIVDSGFETDTVLGNALVNMYSKCGNLYDARSVFNKIPQRNVVSWTAMIVAYCQNGHGKEALKLFQQMQLKGTEPDKVAFINILNVCAGLAALAEGIESHASIIDRGFDLDIGVGNALVHMYGDCMSLDDARSVFHKMAQPNVASWTTMIAAYSRNGCGKEALELFQQMQLRGVEPDKVTFIGILDACSKLGALIEGMDCHSMILNSGFGPDMVLETALVHMYGKCGSLDDARHVFDNMPQRDVVSWNAMITGYSQNGLGKEALGLFQQMQLQGVVPDEITFIIILSGCSHAGLLDDGWWHFVSMNRDYAMKPIVEHFVCMVDLLGRAGQLWQAEVLINNMPYGPYAAAWMSLLGASRMHGNVELGVLAAEHILELDPKNATPFVLLSNIYAAAGKWDDVAKVRKAMKDSGVKTKPGRSCIEVNKEIHEFVV